MKKTLLIVLVLALALNINAQYRKSWDFTKWSDATVANLKADDGWSDIEKSTSSEPTDISKDNCFWEVSAAGSTSSEVTLTANGETISELEGLYYLNTSDRSLAIAVNYGDATSVSGDGFGPYHGSAYLWLGSSKRSYFLIPHVARGTKIKMGVESHKLTDSRGVNLYIGSTSGTQLLDPDGNSVSTPTEYEEQTWYVPEDATDTPNDDDTYDIVIYNTNGCHIYYITVGDGDSPDIQEAKNVAYVADSSTLDEDYAYIYLDGASGVFNLTLIESSSESSLEELQEYDAVVISPTVAATDAIVPTLKSAIAYEPVLNLNAALYETWGYGSAVTTSETAVTVADGYSDSDLFTDLDASAGLELLYDGGITGVSLGEYFASDDTIAVAGEAVAIHQHNSSRNSYLFLPYTLEDMPNADQDILSALIVNATSVVAATKTTVTSVTIPVITQENKHLETEVTITESNKNAVVYYTTDGTDPTTASSLYSEPFTLTAACTVKAMAVADGYNPSSIASLDIVIKEQVATPVISVTNNSDNSEITITCDTEDAKIYYSYNEDITDSSIAQEYTGTITLSEEPTFIYAFACLDGYVQSEMSQEYVSINSLTSETIRLDTLAHFDANETDWLVDYSEYGGTGSASAYYYFGKSAWNYYSYDSDGNIVYDSDGNPMVDDDALKTIYPNNENGWIVKTRGEVITGELQLSYAPGVGNGAANRYADTAEDMIGGVPSKGCIDTGSKISGEPYTASIETTDKYTAPFDVVTYVGNGTGSSIPECAIQVSADGETWTGIGDIKMSETQRYYKKTRVSCEGTGEYYVRLAHTGGGSKAQVYDIYILNNGEVSQKYDPETAGGIEETPAASVLCEEVYSVNGVRQESARKGLNIVRRHYSDGSARTVKVIVR